jgi:hypothetical protein
MRKKRIFLWGVAVIAVLLCAVWYSSPLRRPNAGVRAWVLKKTPLGSAVSDVELAVTKHGWFVYRREGGYDGHWSFGGTFIRGELGDYQGLPLRTSVTAFWEFDASNQLTNVLIWKTMDGL